MNSILAEDAEERMKARRPIACQGVRDAMLRTVNRLYIREGAMVRDERLMQRTFFEFFAGGGMARAGLGSGWHCLFANDIDLKKAAAYDANWGAGQIRAADVKNLTTADLPAPCDLAWASFPCQDLSLAGDWVGLKGKRSGTFWPFWKLMKGLIGEKRPASVVVLENVCGALTSHGGKDFAAICRALHLGGYRYGALVIDAALFLPQSRPRLFIVGVHKSLQLPQTVLAEGASELWHTAALRIAFEKLPGPLKQGWVWWKLPAPAPRTARFVELIEEEPLDMPWHSAAETRRILSMMSRINREKVKQAQRSGERMVGAFYKRTRRDAHGHRVQRAEVRFDDLAGCLRTPAGGSSRQSILVVNANSIRSRLLSARETARLMGLPESYRLPASYNDAYHLTGDGVVVPVVRFLAAHLLEPLLEAQEKRAAA